MATLQSIRAVDAIECGTAHTALTQWPIPALRTNDYHYPSTPLHSLPVSIKRMA